MAKINNKIWYIGDVNELSMLSKLILPEEPIEQDYFIIPINIITKAIDGTTEVTHTCTSGKFGVPLSGDGNDVEDA